jgi:hypothetical protein
MNGEKGEPVMSAEAKWRELQRKADAYTASAGFPAVHDNLKIGTDAKGGAGPARPAPRRPHDLGRDRELTCFPSRWRVSGA